MNFTSHDYGAFLKLKSEEEFLLNENHFEIDRNKLLKYFTVVNLLYSGGVSSTKLYNLSKCLACILYRRGTSSCHCEIQFIQRSNLLFPYTKTVQVSV